MPIIVGDNIRARMAELGDQPIEPPAFKTYRLGDGDLVTVEECWGTRGLYKASNASGNWETYGPFGAGA